MIVVVEVAIAIIIAKTKISRKFLEKETPLGCLPSMAVVMAIIMAVIVVVEVAVVIIITKQKISYKKI